MMFTIFNMLDRAAELNSINNRTYASINETLVNSNKEQSIHEQRKQQWGLNHDETALYDEIAAGDRTRLLRFG